MIRRKNAGGFPHRVCTAHETVSSMEPITPVKTEVDEGGNPVPMQFYEPTIPVSPCVAAVQRRSP